MSSNDVASNPFVWSCRRPIRLADLFLLRPGSHQTAGQRDGDVSRTIRRKRSKLLLTPPSKLAPQEPRTGVGEPWPSNKASARTRLIGYGRVISSNPTFRKLSNYLGMRSFWRS